MLAGNLNLPHYAVSPPGPTLKSTFCASLSAKSSNVKCKTHVSINSWPQTGKDIGLSLSSQWTSGLPDVAPKPGPTSEAFLASGSSHPLNSVKDSYSWTLTVDPRTYAPPPSNPVEIHERSSVGTLSIYPSPAPSLSSSSPPTICIPPPLPVTASTAKDKCSAYVQAPTPPPPTRPTRESNTNPENQWTSPLSVGND
ncbi:uncharacterized protein C8Q71DRAFT_561130 [Rhodofomes roseus]|uniref:Uncharacterized protein n=1 Tax=Rhodofomes roseus TaxID=34475 RepID=A0ABQ8KIG0_9APHY|nr:uncharacterized protein C8Q71DRAFT_561130 [Rhodofomes roseus]KAH9837781.1 hypothetical protein C8Q71DRAFT_561130 [Rhodofomes roseus]